MYGSSWVPLAPPQVLLAPPRSPWLLPTLNQGILMFRPAGSQDQSQEEPVMLCHAWIRLRKPTWSGWPIMVSHPFRYCILPQPCAHVKCTSILKQKQSQGQDLPRPLPFRYLLLFLWVPSSWRGPPSYSSDEVRGTMGVCSLRIPEGLPKGSPRKRFPEVSPRDPRKAPSP